MSVAALEFRNSNTKTDTKKDSGKPSVKVSLFKSLWEDEGRRVLFMLLVVVLICILVAIFVNLVYPLKNSSKAFSALESMNDNYDRLLVPVGYLLALMSLLFFSLSVSYGEYTDVVVGGRTLHAKSFFKKLSFYSVILGAVLLLSWGVTNIASKVP